MNKINRDQFEKILQNMRPAKKPDAAPSGLPESGRNENVSSDSIDAHPYQVDLIENLREGHITGQGGSVLKNAADASLDLTPANKQEIAARKAQSAAWVPEMGLLNYNLFSTPLETAMAVNRDVTSTLPGTVLGYGLAGAGLSWGSDKLKNYVSGKELTPEQKRSQRLRAALIGIGAAGVGLGLRNRVDNDLVKASSFGMDPLTFIAAKLQDDTSLNSIQQQQMLSSVTQLSRTQQSGLIQVLKTVAGAGIGAVIAKYLMNFGIVGTVGGSLLGALMGSRAGANPAPIPGTINNSVDFFGRPY